MAKNVMPVLHIRPSGIKNNPENPRLIFREAEMNELLESIRQVGIKVPISVYKDGDFYYLIDGERRWKCAIRLNLSFIPALVQPKPTVLENLLMMFNIHNVRVDWDLMPMALKLGKIRDLLKKAGESASPKDLAAMTGVRLPTVRRALDLLTLPEKYKVMLLKESEKPRKEQLVTADLFIEVYKSMHVVERYTPEVFDKIDKDEYIEAMVEKYVSRIIDNVVAYREVSKIARAELAGLDREIAVPFILRLVKDREYTIKQAYRDTVQSAYEQRDLTAKINSLVERLATFRSHKQLPNELIVELRRLRDEINRLLEG
jgi:ParB family chromosome partitioning protein